MEKITAAEIGYRYNLSDTQIWAHAKKPGFPESDDGRPRRWPADAVAVYFDGIAKGEQAKTDALAARDEEIRMKKKRGASWGELVAEYNLSPARIGQILSGKPVKRYQAKKVQP